MRFAVHDVVFCHVSANLLQLASIALQLGEEYFKLPYPAAKSDFIRYAAPWSIYSPCGFHDGSITTSVVAFGLWSSSRLLVRDIASCTSSKVLYHNGGIYVDFDMSLGHPQKSASAVHRARSSAQLGQRKHIHTFAR